MTLADIAHAVREAWDVLFRKEPSHYLVHLEREIMQLQSDKHRLEGKCDMLQLKLETALAPKPVVVTSKRVIPRIPPMESGWEAELRRHTEENERLDREEAEKAKQEN